MEGLLQGYLREFRDIRLSYMKLLFFVLTAEKYLQDFVKKIPYFIFYLL